MDKVLPTQSPLITVIVPVYNAAEYLDRCLSSIVNQTYRNLEIILVNDGSTDGSEEICRRYMQADQRVHLYNQKNQGIAAARNAGLDHMHGAYLSFVDADDYLSLSCIEILLDKLQTTGVYLAVCDFDTPSEEEEGLPAICSRKNIPVGRLSRDRVYDLLRKPHKETQFSVVWGKLYDKKIFRELRFEIGMFYEDTAIFHEIFSQVTEICYVDLPLYHYVQTRNSIQRKNGLMAPRHSDYFKALLKRLAYFQSYGKRRYIRSTALQIVNTTISMCESLGLERQKKLEYINCINEEILRITGKKYFMFRYRMYLVAPKLFSILLAPRHMLPFVSPRLYCFAKKCYGKLRIKRSV